jgi:hypothetical protein
MSIEDRRSVERGGAMEEKTKMEVGTRVLVHLDFGGELETLTRSKPWMLGGHTWVVQVNGIAGCYDLTHMEIIR